MNIMYPGVRPFLQIFGSIKLTSFIVTSEIRLIFKEIKINEMNNFFIQIF